VLPEVPSLYESGYQGYELYNWVGIFAPARTPPEAISYLHRGIVKTAEQPAFRERFERVGLDLTLSASPEEFAGFVRKEIENWSRQIKAAGIQPE
jgi:tripartite-type tricarboxylate transporter receptor subunit TctC